MEIQKIFSDQYGEERLYSVLMNEEELALFSEIQKEFARAVKTPEALAREAKGKEVGAKIRKIKEQEEAAIKGIKGPHSGKAFENKVKKIKGQTDRAIADNITVARELGQASKKAEAVKYVGTGSLAKADKIASRKIVANKAKGVLTSKYAKGAGAAALGGAALGGAYFLGKHRAAANKVEE